MPCYNPKSRYYPSWYIGVTHRFASVCFWIVSCFDNCINISRLARRRDGKVDLFFILWMVGILVRTFACRKNQYDIWDNWGCSLWYGDNRELDFSIYWWLAEFKPEGCWKKIKKYGWPVPRTFAIFTCLGYLTLTFVACSPFGPSSMLNSTSWPSSRFLNPSMVIAE